MSSIVMKDKISKGKFASRITSSIILLVLLPIYLIVVHFLTKAVVDEGKLFHWLPIVVSAVACIMGGIIAGNCDYATEHWTKPYVQGSREWVCDPIGKTVGEVNAFVQKHYKKDEFNVSDLTIVIGFLAFDLVIISLALFLSLYALNTLVVFPVWIVVALISRKPTGQDYLTAVLGQDWGEYVCPHCGGICGKFDYTRENVKESRSLGSKQVEVTDKYTNGLDTVYVDRTETRYFIKENSSWDMVYACPRCKKEFKKHFSYTKEI